MYWDILAIRNGKSPGPDYGRIYWDLVLQRRPEASPGRVGRPSNN